MTSYKTGTTTFERFSSSLCALIICAVISIPALFSLTTQAVAEDMQRLSAEEIETLLSGNTAIGSWDGKNYRQYFSDDGVTIYAQEGSRSSRGRWRLNRDKNLYESWWENSDWSGYPIARKADQFFWISHSLPPQSFVVVPGQQLTE